MEKLYDLINQQIEESKKIYIYESPDNGKTIYKREFGKSHNTRKLIN